MELNLRYAASPNGWLASLYESDPKAALRLLLFRLRLHVLRLDAAVGRHRQLLPH